MDIGPVWTAGSYDQTISVSDDGGVEYKTERRIMVFGTYFFLSNTRSEHQRKVYNVVDLLSNVGGIMTSFLGVGAALATYVNKKLFVTRMMQELQYVQVNDQNKVD